MTTQTNDKYGRYDTHTIEQKWREQWEQIDLYRTSEDPHKPNYYILDFFPYPSGEGLSVGHCRNYVPTCVSARFMRMRGYNVLHPMGWDAFGLPAENYAIKHHIHPGETTHLFSSNYRRQMKLVECSYDWAREINSTDPAYYKWTQWFFLLLFKRGLAYQAMGSQWWCPKCQTILANEQVENGRCWRCDSEVTKKELQQWYFKITDYAERLLADLDTIEWPERIKTMQRNWISRSEGAEIIFKTSEVSEISVFTTRPDTLFGATFLALAPEHPLAEAITTAEQKTAVSAYIQAAKRQTDIARMAADTTKTGVFTGATAVHPITGQPIPIWVADYVLMGYGSGAVMGVPAHDNRDFAFATTYGLPIIEVVSPDGHPHGTTACFSDEGILINSGVYSGMGSAEGAARMVADLQADGLGSQQVSYKMRDWLISRQRYWGAPIPIIHCPACGAVPVPEADLPVLLPDTADFAPSGDGRSPLSRIASWVNIPCPQCGGPAQRETDTMDGFACSSWYFLRFAHPHYADGPFDPAAVQRWLPVDVYVGGAEHAVMHLLYARFWTKVMHDAGLVSFIEPFTRLMNQGVLSSPIDGKRMSKSKGNVITPDEVVANYGTDALRAYVLFLGPFDADVIWDDTGIRGITRFLSRFWQMGMEVAGGKWQVASTESDGFERERHKTIKRVTRDMEGFRFNTAVSALMEYLNYLESQRRTSATAISGGQWQQAVETMALLLAPIAPFVAEEVWHALGHADSVHHQPWPTFDEGKTAESHITIVVQVNGKVRDRVLVAADAAEEVVQETAVSSPLIQKVINGRAIQQVFVVPGKLVNIVV